MRTWSLAGLVILLSVPAFAQIDNSPQGIADRQAAIATQAAAREQARKLQCSNTWSTRQTLENQRVIPPSGSTGDNLSACNQ